VVSTGVSIFAQLGSTCQPGSAAEANGSASNDAKASIHTAWRAAADALRIAIANTPAAASRTIPLTVASTKTGSNAWASRSSDSRSIVMLLPLCAGLADQLGEPLEFIL